MLVTDFRHQLSGLDLLASAVSPLQRFNYYF